MKLLATGDTHIGAGVERLGPWRLDDQATVLQAIAALAHEERVDAVLFAGDAFEGPRPKPEELVVFGDFLRALEPIPVVAVSGNRPHGSTTPDIPEALSVFSDRLTLHRTPGWDYVAGATICCLPNVPVSRLVASQNGGDRDSLNELAAAHLLNVARGLRAQCEGPAVLLAHWSVTGASLPSGLPIEMAREPILDLFELEAMGFDAIVLGHIHKSQLLGDGRAFYCGSPMPLSFGEPGEHGVYLVDFADTIPIRFVPIESRAFVRIDWSPDSAYVSFQEMIRQADLDLLNGPVVRLRYSATEEQQRRIDQQALRQALLDAGAVKVFIEAEIVRETRARVEGIDETLDEAAAFALWLAAEGIEGEQAAKLGERHAALMEEVAA